MPTTVEWISLGHRHYDEALDIQMKRAEALLTGADERQAIYTVEHPPTITIGRNGTTDNIVADQSFLEAQGFAVRHVDRGGDVTYHGPGQLVVYPVLHLAPWDNDVKQYVRNLEESVIQALAEVGIVAQRHEEYPGVWVGDAKICAVGARVKKRPSGEFVTYHGIALNVNTNLAHFQTIVPCGIADKGVTSIERETGHAADFGAWETKLRQSFYEVFQFEV
ncbi:lipoyl(octanoyl) transferase LipB [Alicyclobacillus fastidiosus]|uniref:Octanoyltransferase n=1 Tax=Alicyclobacillus fastidiosus TaxID=392011 RepID=A0ABY6ZQE7_9BACL|nr:lipoyl(octanoyl) transferase LipB [Alicyclobacillus fastidiosus]WAH44336.1 lipoyl(octanoyl) transferase LipB [Alicyclobacillus fastidiosus]GMA60666.1 octanoyltransferase [Alicyclobacillus fastidiosus]